MPRHDPDQKTKQNILETAMRLFAEKGLENVNVEDVVKDEMIFQINVMAPYMEKLLNEGNKDGSMNVVFPKQASQIIAWLTASWLTPYAFEVSYEEYVDKILFFEQLSTSLGVPVIEEEMKEIYLTIGRNEFKKE